MIMNADINVGPGHYRNLKADELLIAEVDGKPAIWFTVQGEGPFAGQPAIFVRLAGCNRGRKEGMGCEFCDTKFHFDQGQVLSFNAIARTMRTTLISGEGLEQWQAPPKPLVVITGGEPMMQDNLVAFIYRLIEWGYKKIQIESNGDRLLATLAFDPGTGYIFKDFLTLVVSPKTTNGKYKTLKPEILARADALKFVIEADPESPYYDIPAYALEFPREVYLSPMAAYRREPKPGEIASGWDHSLIDPEKTRANYAHAADLAMKYGKRLSIQSHLFASIA